MSVPAQRALRAAIDSRRFDRVYYLHGDDDFRKDEALSQLVRATADEATRDFNVDVFRGPDVDAERLATALSALPMLAERRVVVVRDVGGLKKAARAELMRYLGTPAPETVVVLTSVAGAKPDAELVALATSVAFPPLALDDVAPWLEQHARKHGIALTREAATLIAEAVAGDLSQAVGELDKVASFAHGRDVTATDVEAVVGVRRSETVGELLDAVAARDGARACGLVERVLAQPKTSGVLIVGALTAQVLAIGWGRAARAAGLPASRLESEFYGLLKSGGAFPGRPWGDAVKCWAKNASRASDAGVERALACLVDADLALKDTRVSSEAAVIESLVLALCVREAPRAAA